MFIDHRAIEFTEGGLRYHIFVFAVHYVEIKMDVQKLLHLRKSNIGDMSRCDGSVSIRCVGSGIRVLR